MSKEIVLPYHLYQRIKASAGEHGGIGSTRLFSGPTDGYGYETGVPLCAHGHAWGTCLRYNVAYAASLDDAEPAYEEPQLADYLTFADNDDAIEGDEQRISFDEWCRRLNVKCGPKPAEVESPELVTVS